MFSLSFSALQVVSLPYKFTAARWHKLDKAQCQMKLGEYRERSRTGKSRSTV